jgi:hypothetical protein
MENTLAEQVKAKAVNNVINLGTANGWRKEDGEFYQALTELKIPNTQQTKNLGRCYNEYSFDVNIEDTTYKVVHRVDSGD